MKSKRLQNLTELIIFAMLGAVMLILKKYMEWLPNIHPLGMFIASSTVAYRKKALIPLYTYVFLDGFLSGFAIWWIPYLYIWTVLWAMIMLLPKNMKPKAAVPVYAIVCGIHGLLFGTLYAPFQALAFKLNFQGMLAWIAAGFPFDLLHAAGDFAAGLLVVPISNALISFQKKANKS